MIAALFAQISTGDDLYVAQNIFWWFIAILMVIAAIKVVTTDNIVHAALYLVIVLAGVAAQFIFLGAEFAAATQVLVYIGAIVVLLLFGIMLTRGSLGDEELTDNEQRGMGALVGLMLFAVMAFALVDGFEDVVLPEDTRNLVEVQAPIDTTLDDDTFINVTRGSDTAAIGDAIFEKYIVPFEAVSVLLLAALIGAIVIARKE